MIKKRILNWHKGRALYQTVQKVLGKGITVTSWPSGKKPGYMRYDHPAYHNRDWYVSRMPRLRNQAWYLKRMGGDVMPNMLIIEFLTHFYSI